ncbi:hypothetical protein OSB04_013638 [Centaurea solstitialis]|uniref:Uncharacterized protein n=1 Tax=Centaurea solstitialis TaxID=347529 RepID=A0AA38WQR1_9ASTR|nr:hypothetical protein OSB04_013638 [Centaurea solstitialis]
MVCVLFQGRVGNGKYGWLTVKDRCRSEWLLFQDRLANAEKDYFKKMEGGPNSTTLDWLKVFVSGFAFARLKVFVSQPVTPPPLRRLFRPSGHLLRRPPFFRPPLPSFPTPFPVTFPTTIFSYDFPATTIFSYDFPATTIFSYDFPATTIFSYDFPATTSFSYDFPATTIFSGDFPTTTIFSGNDADDFGQCTTADGGCRRWRLFMLKVSPEKDGFLLKVAGEDRFLPEKVSPEKISPEKLTRWPE